jgi:predicted unusual protein kinase regulating ubiquinone biosynthesis (AarF/ABC1/UbiB family)
MSNHKLKNRIKKIKRGFLIWKILILLLFNLWLDNLIFKIFRTNTDQKNKVQIKRARWFTNQLIELGSAFIKIGQLLSARPDLIPNTWIQELSKLQDQVPQFSYTKVEEIIKKELGHKFSEINHITSNPIGSASLAQVHKATLKNEKEVVFKVQRPNLKNLFTIDLNIMQQIAFIIQKNKNWSRGRNWVAIAKECRKVLMKELDFKCEAQYAARFRQQFLNDENVEVPEVIWNLSTEKVLCLSYLEGTKISDIEKLKSKNIDLSKIAEIGAISYLKQLVNYGFFHADPHPGNLAVSNSGKLIFYDFGMMGNISNNLQASLGSMVQSAALRDASSLVTQLQQARLISKDIDVGPVRRLVRLMLKEALTPPFSPNIIEKLSGDLYELVYETPFQLPVDLIFVMRALSTFEGVGRMLDPGFNLVSITKPYLIDLMTSNNQTPNDLINQFGRQVGELGSKAVGIPKRIDESLERLEQGDLQLQIRMGESDRQFKKMFTAQKSLGHSILIGSLIIATSLLVTNNQNNFAILPLIFATPISIDWIKCQLSMRKGSRIEKLKQ